MAYKPRYRGMTARAILTNAERTLRAGEPLSEALSAHLADAIKAMLEGVKPETAWGLSKPAHRPPKIDKLFIVEQVDILNKGYPAKPYTVSQDEAFFIVGELMGGLSDETIKSHYKAAKRSPEYLGMLDDMNKPDLITKP